MKISELFRRLSIGELSNLALANDGNGEIIDAKKPAILLHANNGLDRLHTRFLLRPKELRIQTFLAPNIYALRPENVITQAGGFILDDESEPFTGGVLKILEVQDVAGNSYPLNTAGDRWSLHTLLPDKLRIPFELTPQVLHVTYQAAAENLTLDPNDPADDPEFDLPEVLEPALTAFIAGEMYGAMNGKEHAAIAAGHRSRFEEICIEVEMRDMVSTSWSGKSSKFAQRGWV